MGEKLVRDAFVMLWSSISSKAKCSYDLSNGAGCLFDLETELKKISCIMLLVYKIPFFYLFLAATTFDLCALSSL